jgi:hypothetical protein
MKMANDCTELTGMDIYWTKVLKKAKTGEKLLDCNYFILTSFQQIRPHLKGRSFWGLPA